MSYSTLNETQRELYLYGENTGAVWSQMIEPAFRNYERKQAKGVYDSALAAKGLTYAADAAAKGYVREFGATGDKWHAMFSVADRRAVAEAWRDAFEAERACGNSWL